jgi:hypothetical protein
MVTVLGGLGWLLSHLLQRRKAKAEERQVAATERQVALSQRQEERAAHDHHVSVWKDIADAHRTQVESTAVENAKLEARVKKNKKRISALKRAWAESEAQAQIFSDGFEAVRNEADSWRGLAEQTRAALHRSGLCMFASYEMFTRARRLRVWQSADIDAVFADAIDDVCKVYGVEPEKVRATFDAEEPPDRTLLAPATLALMFENIRSTVKTHLFAPVQNAMLGAKVIELMQENNTVSFEELAPKYFDLLRADTEELFRPYPGALEEQAGEERAQEQEAEARAARAAFES